MTTSLSSLKDFEYLQGLKSQWSVEAVSKYTITDLQYCVILEVCNSCYTLFVIKLLSATTVYSTKFSCQPDRATFNSPEQCSNPFTLTLIFMVYLMVSIRQFWLWGIKIFCCKILRQKKTIKEDKWRVRVKSMYVKSGYGYVRWLGGCMYIGIKRHVWRNPMLRRWAPSCSDNSVDIYIQSRTIAGLVNTGLSLPVLTN